MRRSPATAPGRRRTLFRTRCPGTCRGEGKRPAAVVWDECAPCAARHSERNGADRGKSLRGGGLSARDVPGTCRRAGEGPAAVVRGECAPCAARHSERSGADCGKSLRGGRLSARDVPGTAAGSKRTSGNGGRRRVRKTAGSRKIDENLIFGTRAFVFYPLSLAAPKILRLNKIANKFAFVSGLFVSLRLKPKYANKP